MPNISVITDIERHPWRDLKTKKWEHGSFLAIGRMPHGMESGKAAVFVKIELEDGSLVTAQTSLDLLKCALAAFQGAEIRDGVPQDNS